ncbi:hypothetical protein [Kribbella soli]|uniref:Dienelactone hydrolase family protein n=1 Tax=Kribbella soli TaxID=1124743 RepID=A0A4R0H5U7_9ACTN|nr:hypothetical protein [Kribbella soli]TCC05088.1 hypothetical protein E0H45_23795 [Kribbella soli]
MTSEIDTGSGLLPVHEWGSADTEAPAVLLLQEIFGVSDYIKQRAADPAVSSPDVLVSYYGSALPGLVGLAPKVTAWRRTEDFLAQHLPTSQGQA